MGEVAKKFGDTSTVLYGEGECVSEGERCCG